MGQEPENAVQETGSPALPQAQGEQGASPSSSHCNPLSWYFLLLFPKKVFPFFKTTTVQHFLEGLLMAFEI